MGLLSLPSRGRYLDSVPYVHSPHRIRYSDACFGSEDGFRPVAWLHCGAGGSGVGLRQHPAGEDRSVNLIDVAAAYRLVNGVVLWWWGEGDRRAADAALEVVGATGGGVGALEPAGGGGAWG